MLNFKIKPPQESQPEHKTPTITENKPKKHKDHPPKRKPQSKHQPSRSNIETHIYHAQQTNTQPQTFTHLLRHSHHPNAHSTLPHTPQQL